MLLSLKTIPSDDLLAGVVWLASVMHFLLVLQPDSIPKIPYLLLHCELLKYHSFLVFHKGMNCCIYSILAPNPCRINNGGCDHICLKTYTGSTCSCREGFKLGSDKKKCIVKGKPCFLFPSSVFFPCLVNATSLFVIF